MTQTRNLPSRLWPYSVGLLGFAAIVWLAVQAYAPAIERALSEQIEQALADHEYPPITVEVDGRDVTLSGLVYDTVLRATMIDYIEALPGVSLIKDRLKVATPEEQSPRQARLYLQRVGNHVTITGQLPQGVDLTALMTAMNRAGIDSLSDEAARVESLPPLTWLNALIELGPELIAIPDFKLSVVEEQFELHGTVASEEQSEEVNRLVALHLNAFPVTSLLDVAEYEESLAEFEPLLESSQQSSPWLTVAVDQEHSRVEGLVGQSEAVDALLSALKQRHPKLDRSALMLRSDVNTPHWIESAVPLTDSLFGLEQYELVLKDDKASINTFVQSNLVKKRLEQRLASLYPRLETDLAIEVRPDAPEKQRKRLSHLLGQIDLQGVQFHYGTTDISESSQAILDQVTEVLNLYPSIQVEIGGHTDSYGDEYPNLALSQRRAESVAAYLRNRGVEAERLKAVGYGESVPIGDNATEQGRARNRRIEFKF